MLRHLLFLVFLVAVFRCDALNAEVPQPKLKIGVILSLSGGLEQWCTYYRKGIEIALAEPRAFPVQVVYEDDHSLDKKGALTAAQRLLEVEKVDVLFSWSAATLPVLEGPVTKAKTPLVVGAYDKNVSRAGKFVFGAFVNYEEVSKEIARFLVEKKGARRVGMLLAADEWSQNFLRPFSAEVEKLGGRIAFSETISPEETNTRPLVLKIKNSGVDAVLAPLYGASLFSFLREMRAIKASALIHVADGMFEEDIRTAGNSAEGIFATQIWIESPLLRTRLASADRETNSLQLGLVAIGYDFMRHIRMVSEETVRRGQSLSRQSLRDGLAEFQSEGFLGSHAFGKPPPKSGEVAMVVKNGKFVLVP